MVYLNVFSCIIAWYAGFMFYNNNSFADTSFLFMLAGRMARDFGKKKKKIKL